MRVVLFDPAHPLDHTFAVAVCGVHHDGVHTGFDQGFHTFFGTFTHTHGSPHTQTACGVAGGVGEAGLFGDVLDSDQALELEIVVDDQQALKFVFVQQGLGFGCACAFRHSDQLFAWRHDLADWHVQTGFKAQIAPCDQAHHLAAITDRETGDTQFFRQLHDLQHGVGWGDDDRVAQHARLVAFDLGHVGGLLLRGQVFVDDADSALLRNGNGQSRLCHRVHGGRHQGQVQSDVA